MQKFRYATSILCLAAIAAIGAVFFQGPIPQDPAYHRFADTREITGLPNFWNVLSNLPFFLFGLYGLSRIPKLARQETQVGYAALCVGTMLVGAGSAFYHLAPSTSSLVWDRLPMTVAFMALFSILLDEREVLGKGRHTLWPLLSLGIASVAYWYWTESAGAGDLRPYVLVQFLPILLIPAILLLFPVNYLSNRLLVLALVFYALAKISEQFDQQIFHTIGTISGHTIKHLVASLAVLCIIVAVPTRASANNSSKPKARVG